MYGSHTYSSERVYTVILEVMNDDGGGAGVGTLTVTAERFGQIPLPSHFWVSVSQEAATAARKLPKINLLTKPRYGSPWRGFFTCQMTAFG